MRSTRTRWRASFAAQHNDADLLGALQSIGDVYQEQGYNSAALDTFQQALDIARKLGDRPNELQARHSIGIALAYQGRFAAALEAYQQLQVIAHDLDVRVFEAIALLSIGQVFFMQGRFDAALEPARQALAIARELKTPAKLEAVALTAIAQSYVFQQRHAEALAIYRQTLAMARARGDSADEIKVLNTIGTVLKDQQQTAEALASFQQALAIADAQNDRAGKASTLENMGDLYTAEKRYADALATYQQALSLARERGDRSNEAQALRNIGTAYRNQQRDAEALAAHTQALTISEELDNRLDEELALILIGQDYIAQQRDAEALRAYQQAADVFDTLRATAGSEAGRTSFIDLFIYVYERAAGLAHKLGQDDLAFDLSERARARAFLDSLATGYIDLSDDAASALFQRERETAAALQQSQDALNQARAGHPDNAALLAALETQLAQFKTAHQQAEQAIQQRGDQLAALVPGRAQAPLTRAAVQALLPDDATLVSYYTGDETTLAFVLTRAQAHTVELPVGRAELERQVRQLRDGLINAPPAQKSLQPQAAATLYQQLIAPLRQNLTTPRLMIVPHGPLHYLPFAALSDAPGHVLLDDFTLTMLPSASVLRFVQRPTVTSSALPRALAFGNPDLTLPSAAEEARAVASLFGGQAIVGTEATSAALRARAPQANILHLATHGQYNPTAPLASYLTLASTTPISATAQIRGAGAENAGRLEAAQVYGLDLKQTDLVVLSACETNLGALSQGDELVGLTRAFFFAGAPSVVSSLWRVPDEATRELMTRFYTHLRAGASKAEALRQAQVEVRQIYPSPYYWAGFVLSGDGENALVAAPWWRRAPWWGWLAALALIVALVAGVGVYHSYQFFSSRGRKKLIRIER